MTTKPEPVTSGAHSDREDESFHLLSTWSPEWAAIYERMATGPGFDGALPRKFVELIALGINAACTAMNRTQPRRHIRAALDAGASRAEILEVLKMAALLAIHSCSLGMPLLLAQMRVANSEVAARAVSAPTSACDAMRGKRLWNSAWDPFYALDPDWIEAFMAAGVGI